MGIVGSVNNKYMSKRQDYWKEQGYTKEQIQIHLEWERGKSKERRERGKRNNLKNQALIKQIKNEILYKTFGRTTILKISPTNDGVGFWFTVHKKFSDGSEGDFRYFYRFSDYKKYDFIKDLKWL